MPKPLIEYVQDILSSMDSDEVNSISDTVESMQVATILKNCYEELVANIELPEEYTLFHLDSSSDVSKPTVMRIPSNISSLEWIKYDKYTDSTPYQQLTEIEYLVKEDFLAVINKYRQTNSNVFSYTLTTAGGDFELLATNDVHPTFYTTFDNNTVVFNSYDMNQDTTLQSNKTLCYGKKDFDFIMSDNFIPFNEKRYEPLLFNAAKAQAFADLKQVTNAKAEAAEKRGRIKIQSGKHSVPFGKTAYDFYKGYGRRN